VDIQVHVSRTQVLAGAITIRAGGSILLVPTSFSPHADLLRSGERFLLKAHHTELAPTDSSGCLLMEHQAFLAKVRDPSSRSVLDGERFLLLSEVLESLANT